MNVRAYALGLSGPVIYYRASPIFTNLIDTKPCNPHPKYVNCSETTKIILNIEYQIHNNF